MASNGRKFLWLNRDRKFLITKHALQRIKDRTGVSISTRQAYNIFLGASQLKQAEMFLLGYRPNYNARYMEGTLSWYFRIDLNDRELIAVVSQKNGGDNLAWVTTYCRDQQNDHLALTHFEALAFAAYSAAAFRKAHGSARRTGGNGRRPDSDGGCYYPQDEAESATHGPHETRARGAC